MRGEKDVRFTAQETNGLKLFRMHCVSCHKEPLFSGEGFASNGLPVNPALNDPGRYAVTHHARDSMKFRIPTLRNSEFSFPYMHDGRFRKLKEVIRYYSDSIPTGDPYVDERLRKPLHLTEQQQKDLLAFLYTLTDKAFLFDTRFRYPGLNTVR
jgi:cytochrome c peroxidase